MFLPGQCGLFLTQRAQVSGLPQTMGVSCAHVSCLSLTVTITIPSRRQRLPLAPHGPALGVLHALVRLGSTSVPRGPFLSDVSVPQL